jgi:hypothetical protein
MPRNAIFDSRFAKELRVYDAGLSDKARRDLVFRYAKLYQDDYSFVQLDTAFAFLELVDNQPSLLSEDLSSVRYDVECAMGEYFESLNHVASALYRLLDERHLTYDDVVSCVGSIWEAFACNESEFDFVPREDQILCGLLAVASAPYSG